ncbi:MAG: diaminopimelate decarboxylase [Prevotellaceae bacterium]|jgi:diaminopimelate decarboxylase|nr:diaminopimelate decarboxylase [Prevotellaceae bacterium]
MKTKFPLEKFKQLSTPFYYYDVDLLKETAQALKNEADKYGYIIHYALKANPNKKILDILKEYGFGADCVSGNEVQRAIDCGFSPDHIAFAGVGKTDEEIETGLDHKIFTFNCESIPEIENINELAKKRDVVADIAIRINPNVDAHTHHYITTGLEENKFGISRWQFQEVADLLKSLKHVRLISLHFHVGSQITDLNVFEALCDKVNEIQDWFKSQGFVFKHVNLGGGLGIDYTAPNEHPIANFIDYFAIINKNLKVEKGQKVHFEIGRAIVGQGGNLITKVLYVKHGQKKSFAIVDAGMTDLIRPALYQAVHKIENITSTGAEKVYDVVGPICESSDCFAQGIAMAEANRGDLLAMRSAGAYGEIMASQYNLRKLPEHYYSDEL